VVITIAIGVIGGVLFHLFLGGDDNIDRLFISLGGGIILISGAAAYLHLSPLFAAMIFGATLANTSRQRDVISRTLANGERPFYFVLLIFAGAMWVPSALAWWLPVALFIVGRTLAKIWTARVSAWAVGGGASEQLGRDWGMALLGQGGLALALALDYGSMEQVQLHSIVFTAAIASVLLTDLGSARIVESVLTPLLRGRRGSVSAPAVPSPDEDSE
jgi:hypothetical protein